MSVARPLKLIATERDEAWRTDAACRYTPTNTITHEQHTDAWFPIKNNGDTIQYAKVVCERCPVRRECLEFALDTEQLEGVWGGLTPVQRRTGTRKYVLSLLDAPVVTSGYVSVRAQRERERAKVRARAVARLVSLHRVEFDALRREVTS